MNKDRTLSPYFSHDTDLRLLSIFLGPSIVVLPADYDKNTIFPFKALSAEVGGIISYKLLSGEICEVPITDHGLRYVHPANQILASGTTATGIRIHTGL